ncbi:MAG TPA: prolyl oligopeptidase family serine peptidase [Xanthomonadales bacterium]|nr:prolyl oligopeptidase family serine peptidase [Xanthomonadales bacterium]
MKIATLLILAFMATVQSVTAAPPPNYFVDESKLPFDGIPGLDSERYWGVHTGAGYRIEIPDNWNGELVTWAHGFRGTGLELTVDNHPLRAFLLANGYAWAASSYSRNDYDPAQGAKDTHALAMYFSDRFGEPLRTYITGASMGGHVTAIMAEQWPQKFAGAMPICGVLGDYELFDFFLDFNLAAQTLSGVNEPWPFEADYLTSVVPATKAALGPAFPYVLNANGTALKSLVQVQTGGARPLFDQGFVFWNGVAGDFLFGLGVGDGTLPRQPGVAVQNIDVIYQFDADPALTVEEEAFNNDVQRVTADRQARRTNGLPNVTPTTGMLKIPMLTLHTLGDLFVPLHMEQEYARRVAAENASDFLVQRVTRDFGHCAFTATELVTTFVDLVAWVEAGVKPAGDDLLDPDNVADPSFGCTFTDPVAPRLWNNPGLAFLAPPSCP